MYLQFAPPSKKLHNAHSMPHFGRQRPHDFTSTAREDYQRQIPQLNFNKYLSQVESQPPLANTDRPELNGRHRSERLADDLIALKRGLRSVISEGVSLPQSDNHTKHKILKRHLGKGDQQHQSRVKEEVSAHKLVPDYNQSSLHNDYYPSRNLTPPKYPLAERKQDVKFDSSSRLQFKMDKDAIIPPSVPFTSSRVTLDSNKIYSPSRDEVYRLRDEIYRLQEDNQKQQETIRKLQNQQHRTSEQNQHLQSEVKRYQDDIAFNNRRMDFLLKENEHLAREAEVVSNNKAVLEERLEVVEEKLHSAQSLLQETVDYQREIKRLKEKLLEVQIEIEEKNTEIGFLTKKLLAVQEKGRELAQIDVSRYEETIDSLQKQLRQLRTERAQPTKRSNEFNDILCDQLSELQKVKGDLALREEELRILRDEMSMQKFKIDNFRNELETERLRFMAEKKNIQVQHDITNQNNLNEISSLKKLIFAIEEKYRISVNDNLRKDDFVKCHILGKTKNEYDRADIEVFFKAYEAEVPKESLRNTLMKEIMQIKELQERIVELETALAASQPSRRLSDLSDPSSK